MSESYIWSDEFREGMEKVDPDSKFWYRADSTRSLPRSTNWPTNLRTGDSRKNPGHGKAMNDSYELISAMITAIGSGIGFETRGMDRHMVHTGFCFPDGDEIHMILKREDDGWVLTDEGHTTMWISYASDLDGSMLRLLETTARSDDIPYEDGIVSVKVSKDIFGRCLRSMMQAILQASELHLLRPDT